MTVAKVTTEEFIRVWKESDSAEQVAETIGVSLRNVYSRRSRIEKSESITLKAKNKSGSFIRYKDHVSRATMEMRDGVIFVASDAHYLPGEPSAAHKAFVKLIKKHKPDVIIMNGDVFDGITISRYPKAYYEAAKPTVKQEIEVVSDRLGEIEKVRGNAKLFWTLGNHDARYEARLANLVPEYQGVAGFSLKEHFPAWLHCMSLMINKNLMVKHRFRGGVHAAWNNVLHSGVSTVTGHLHRLQATILGDYRGNRWGVDTGTLADLDGEHMGYGEDNPMNHASGFAVLTVIDGQLVYPEFCFVRDGVAYFRGKEV
jgi:predicted phosphodiesterase